MNKIIMSLLILALSLCLAAFGGTTDSADIHYTNSIKFSEAEINAAIEIVLADFSKAKAYRNCILTKLWYDESESNRWVKSYMTYGRGGINGINEDNVIIIQAHFDVGKKADIYFNPPSTVTNWHWILIRNSVTDKWVKDDAGWSR